MLKNLHIENVAVIEKTDVEFAEGLNILTGETGAGKSIVIDSLGAVLGNRVSKELVRHGCDKASVSAAFSATEEINEWLRENEIEEDDDIFLKRTVSSDGKSTCRINGCPVPAKQLQEIGQRLMDIHGQNDGRRLLNESSHLAFLDSFGGYQEIIKQYREKYNLWSEIKKKFETVSNDNEDKLQLTEILNFRIRELEDAGLTAGETEELEARHELMKNAEKLSSALDEAIECIYSSDSSAINLTDEASDCMERALRYSPELRECAKEIKDARFMLLDAAEQIRDMRSALDFSPEEYNAVESRLSKLNRLYKKYSSDEAGLINLLEESKDRLNEIEYSDIRIEKLKKELAQAAESAVKYASMLTAARRKASISLSERMQRELKELSMPSVKFCTEITPVENEYGFDKNGADCVRFLMSANAGEEPGRISHIASGGELSRIMLAMKTVFAENDSVESMVFDEIDTGVSGIAAQRVGEKMSWLAGKKQVICITHLPQIACMADAAYNIVKSEDDGRTYTNVNRLDKEGRIKEIARLREGENLSELALKAAAEQLAAADAFKKAKREGNVS